MKKYILLISAIVSIGLTSYFSILPLNGVSQADISNLYSTPITPAGFTFSIWSLIYTSWLALGIYAIIKKQKIKKVLRYKLAFAQILSMVWLIPWHFEHIFISLIIMTLLLQVLWGLMLTKKAENKYFRYTVSLFFGWIAVAFLLNANVTLIEYNSYSYPLFISGLSLGIAANISIYWIYKRNNYIPLLVFLWALLGIMLK